MERSVERARKGLEDLINYVSKIVDTVLQHVPQNPRIVEMFENTFGISVQELAKAKDDAMIALYLLDESINAGTVLKTLNEKLEELRKEMKALQAVLEKMKEEAKAEKPASGEYEQMNINPDEVRELAEKFLPKSMRRGRGSYYGRRYYRGYRRGWRRW